MHTQKLTAVGLGPGDPELITVKGLRSLQQADVIFYPATYKQDEQIKSFSLSILQHYQLGCTFEPMLIPMTGKNQNNHYKTAFEAIKVEVEADKKVVVVSEGDLLFYSTFGYMLPFFKQNNITIELIPGIPAFIDAANKSKQALIEKEQQLSVLPKPSNYQEIKDNLQHNNTVIVMKMCSLDKWYDFIAENGYPFFYAEHLGTDKQFYTTELNKLKNRTFPYFSLIILYNSSI
ncbi:MAG: precorrin-2 C(20)-methyltransferase [Bacteroidota bacterium]